MVARLFGMQWRCLKAKWLCVLDTAAARDLPDPALKAHVDDRPEVLPPKYLGRDVLKGRVRSRVVSRAIVVDSGDHRPRQS